MLGGMNPSATLGAWLDAHAIPQAEMGRVFNVSAVTIHYWVTGDRKPSHQRALAIEAWTSGAIPAASWLDDAARKDSEALAAIEPYVAGPEK